MKVIFGLGNPGRQYQDNRHNIGYKIVEKLAEIWNLKFQRSFKTSSFIAVRAHNKEKVILVKPRTFMNRSGACVKKFMDMYKLRPADILAVYDEIDLPLGTVRFRKKGSCAGHRGMSSVISCLGTEEVGRLRIGIGRPRHKEVADYVLCDFSPKERKVLKEVIDEAVCACINWIDN